MLTGRGGRIKDEVTRFTRYAVSAYQYPLALQVVIVCATRRFSFYHRITIVFTDTPKIHGCKQVFSA